MANGSTSSMNRMQKLTDKVLKKFGKTVEKQKKILDK